MEPTSLRDVCKCIKLSIAAMQDISLKPSKDPPVQRPTVTGLHHNAPDRLHFTDASRNSDMEKGRPSKKKAPSVIRAEPQMIPHCPMQNSLPLGTDKILTTAAAKGNTRLDKAARTQPRTKVADPSKWIRNKRKQLRMEGKTYVTKRRKDGELVTKQQRVMGPRCTSKACRKAANRLCDEINETARKKMFDEFWQRMNWDQRKMHVAGQVDCIAVERSRAVGSKSRRSVSLRYHLTVDCKRRQVCKNMFLSTLGIGEWSVLSWAHAGTTKKTEMKKIRSRKRKVVPQGPRLKAATSPVNKAVAVIQEQENATDKDKNKPPELERPAKNKSRAARPLKRKQNSPKQLRMEGKPYISKRRKDDANVTQAQREMGPRCTSNACKTASNRFCADFSEDSRIKLFTSFWQCMNWVQRKFYVVALVDCDPVERTRASWTQSRRSVSMRYHLIGDGDRKQVCKRMFLSTLGIGEWSVLNWAQNPPQLDNSEDNKKKRTQRKSL